MKHIHPEDPLVTAYALGELPEHEAAQVRRSAAQNPDVQEALDEAAALASLIRTAYQGESHELGDARREAIRRAGRRPVAENLVSLNPQRRWVRPVVVSAAAAVLVACAVWIMQQVPGTPDGQLAQEDREALQRSEARSQLLMAPAPAPKDLHGRVSFTESPPSSLYDDEKAIPSEIVESEMSALKELRAGDYRAYLSQVREAARGAHMPTLAKLPRLVDNPFISTRDASRSSVPLVAGSTSFHLAERFVRTEKRLPPANAVRVEELVNYLNYEDRGDADFRSIKLGAELMRCPWDPSSILMGVLVQNRSSVPLSAEAILEVDIKPAYIRSYRLIGYASVAGESGLSLLRGLPAGASNLVLYQLTPLDRDIFDSHRVLSKVGLKLQPKDNQGLIVPVTSPPRDWINSSNNLQTAVSLAGWGMLLRGCPYAEELTPGILRTVAEEAKLSAEEGDLRRREALQLILDSLPMMKK